MLVVPAAARPARRRQQRPQQREEMLAHAVRVVRRVRPRMGHVGSGVGQHGLCWTGPGAAGLCCGGAGDTAVNFTGCWTIILNGTWTAPCWEFSGRGGTRTAEAAGLEEEEEEEGEEEGGRHSQGQPQRSSLRGSSSCAAQGQCALNRRVEWLFGTIFTKNTVEEGGRRRGGKGEEEGGGEGEDGRRGKGLRRRWMQL